MKQEDFDKGMGPGVEALTASERDDGEAATALIDPVKEAKMMRKFDVSHEMGMKWICFVTKFFLKFYAIGLLGLLYMLANLDR